MRLIVGTIVHILWNMELSQYFISANTACVISATNRPTIITFQTATSDIRPATRYTGMGMYLYLKCMEMKKKFIVRIYASSGNCFLTTRICSSMLECLSSTSCVKWMQLAVTWLDISRKTNAPILNIISRASLHSHPIRDTAMECSLCHSVMSCHGERIELELPNAHCQIWEKLHFSLIGG